MEGDERLAAGKTQRLQTVVDNGEQMVIIVSINLDEHIEVTSGVMTLHHLWDFLQAFNHLVELLRVFQVQTDISTGLVAYTLWIDDEL